MVTALLTALSDSTWQVRQAISEALLVLPAGHKISSQFLEKRLQQLEDITNKQVTADEIVDDLLSALWRIARERQY